MGTRRAVGLQFDKWYEMIMKYVYCTISSIFPRYLILCFRWNIMLFSSTTLIKLLKILVKTISLLSTMCFTEWWGSPHPFEDAPFHGQSWYHHLFERCCLSYNIKKNNVWVAQSTISDLILTGICVNHFHQRNVITRVVVDLFQPWLEVYVCITYFIYDVNEIFTGLIPFALDKLQDFSHLEKK